MLNEVTLFDLKADGIHINIVARFEKDNLIIGGYDIGPKAEEMMGDPDYEYIITIHEPEVKKLFQELAFQQMTRKGCCAGCPITLIRIPLFPPFQNIFLERH